MSENAPRTARRDDALSLGPRVLERLVPLRAPYLLIDRVTHFAHAGAPSLRARRAVPTNDPIFQGHYATFAVMPGTMVLESLAQCCGVLTALVLVVRGAETAGLTGEEALDALRLLDKRDRMDPGYKPGRDRDLEEALRTQGAGRVGLLASTAAKFSKPVFPGDLVELSARLVRELGDFWHFEVEAVVSGATAVSGTVSYALARTP